MSSSRLRNNANQKRASALEALAQAKKSGRRLIEQIQLNEELVYESVSEDEYEITSRKRGSKSASVVIDELYGYDDDENDHENNANRKNSKHKRSKMATVESEPKPLSSTFIKRKQVVKETPRSARSDDALKQEVFESLMISAEANFSPIEDEDLSEINKQLVLFGRKQEVTDLRKGAIQSAKIEPECIIPDFMVDIKAADPQGLDEDQEAGIPLPDLLPETEMMGKEQRMPLDVHRVSENQMCKPSTEPEAKQDFKWLKEKQHEDEVKKVTSSDLVADDNSLYFFWLDACEDPQNPGSIILFGKAKANPDEEVATSCCVVVENNVRNLFVMPRSYMLEDPDDPSTETDQEVTMDDVYTEFRELASKHKVHTWLSAKVTRKYAFDNPEGKIALEADVLKVLYAANLPALPRDARGRSFSHLFGTQTSFLENFLLKRKLMGPQWLKIENISKSNSSRSWVNAEFVTSSPKSVKIIEGRSSPTISVLSLSILCLFNNQTQQNEVVAVSGLLHSEVSIDGATKNPDSLEHFAVIRPIMGQGWPEDLQNTIGRHGISLNVCSNERALLSFLVTKLGLIDPDVIVGHNLYNTTLDILLSRMSEYKLPQWSKLGRLRRPGQPRVSRSGEHSNFSVSVVAGGRLFCDTAVSSKELIRETSYDLTHLSQSLLNVKRDVIDISKMMSTSSDIINVVRYCSNDSYLSLAIMFRLQIIPLTKQLTVLGGHTWAKSLQSARAQRVEFLLLHEFHRLKYIKPEKYSYTERKKQLQTESEHAEFSKKRKPAYSGGLVLDPVKGFYDNYVLLLDFNSLYPSIIQEFNICFTTVKHWQVSDNEAKLPEIPADSEPFGVLPRVIKTLVSRRQEVKRLLKSEANPIARQEYDIRQQALKLVANSMYGCLGFPGSRFYCKPLAALITFQGRSILKKTVDTIESLNYKVIYGDTDSVLIATNSTDLELVEKIGNEVKKEVNKVYRTLEIEIDGIFKSLLLLQKKKYAAIVVTVNNGNITEKREIKGLEMVRRDWCSLSKTIGERIIDIILSTSSRDDVVDSIHVLLRDISQKVRDNQVPVSEFIITKGLSKHPSEYPEGSSLPHVAVALQMIENGDIVRVGDHIPYVICKTDEKSSLFQKARHPSLVQASPDLSLDYEWYLSQQILPPVLRLCAHIVGTDSNRLADCLGLDPSRYCHSHPNSSVDNPQQQSFQTALHLRYLDDDEAFRTVPKLLLRCPACKTQFEFKGAFDSNKLMTGLKCPSSDCSKIFDDACSISYLALQVYKFWMKEVSSFNAGWKVCEDGACNQRSRCGSSCTTCHSPMHLVYKASDLYLVLRYLIAMFDFNRANHRVARENAKRSRQSLPPIEFTVAAAQRSALDTLKSYVESVMLQHSAFSMLEANDVFSMFRRDSRSSVIV